MNSWLVASFFIGLLTAASTPREIARELRLIYSEYKQVQARPTIERLVQLDQRLRRLDRQIAADYNRPGRPMADYESWIRIEKSAGLSYASLGLSIGHWSERLEYSGKLLVQAHRIDPGSEHRAYTLFSTVCNGASHSCDGPPDISAAFRYARQFPDGPFIDDTFLMIAEAHKDLFMVLRDAHRDYKYDCYKRYINRTPRDQQMQRARTTAILYYQKFLARNPRDNRVRRFLSEIKEGTIEGWTYCPD